MNKRERAKLIKLYKFALTTNRDTSLHYPNPTYQFNQGYEWGINQAMRAVGFEQAELFEIWDRVTFGELQSPEPEPDEDPEPGIEDHQHFTVRHDDRRRVFVIIAKPHVLDWLTMPAEVHEWIQRTDKEWKAKGYRYADFDEEV